LAVLARRLSPLGGVQLLLPNLGIPIILQTGGGSGGSLKTRFKKTYNRWFRKRKRFLLESWASTEGARGGL